jgi:cadmium resistance protein CadD (predicted permease)
VELVLLVVVTVAAVAATNLDNLLILVGIQARAEQAFASLIVGMGIASLGLLGLCGVGSVIAAFAPVRWLGLLGLIPIGLGLREFYRLSQPTVTEADGSSTSGASISATGIAGLMLANGADSFGALLPIMAETRTSLLPAVGVTVLFTNLAIAFAARGVAGHPVIGPRVRSVGPKLVPFILIAVGCFVLADTGTDTLQIATPD